MRRIEYSTTAVKSSSGQQAFDKGAITGQKCLTLIDFNQSFTMIGQIRFSSLEASFYIISRHIHFLELLLKCSMNLPCIMPQRNKNVIDRMPALWQMSKGSMLSEFYQISASFYSTRFCYGVCWKGHHCKRH